MADEAGRLVFREGALVTAVRRGHWLLLDELNLAPSDVLEALNRWAWLRRQAAQGKGSRGGAAECGAGWGWQR